MQGHRLLPEHLNKGLDGSRAMQVHGHLDDRGQDRMHELFKASHRAHLNELLAEVVSELVCHSVCESVFKGVYKRGHKSLGQEL